MKGFRERKGERHLCLFYGKRKKYRKGFSISPTGDGRPISKTLGGNTGEGAFSGEEGSLRFKEGGRRTSAGEERGRREFLPPGEKVRSGPC